MISRSLLLRSFARFTAQNNSLNVAFMTTSSSKMNTINISRHSNLLNTTMVEGVKLAAGAPLGAPLLLAQRFSALSSSQSGNGLISQSSLLQRQLPLDQGAMRRENFSTAGAAAVEKNAEEKQQTDSDEESGVFDQYSGILRWLHLFGALGITFCVASAFVAMQIDPKTATPEKKKLKGKLMHLHESIGVFMAILILPRVGARLFTRMPKALPVSSIEKLGSSVSHAALYGVIIFMPVSGLAFGIASAWGVPFFAWNIPGISKERYESQPVFKKIEDFFYWAHHQCGYVLTYFLLPAHVGAVVFHKLFQGHNLLFRMNPFAKKIKK